MTASQSGLRLDNLRSLADAREKQRRDDIELAQRYRHIAEGRRIEASKAATEAEREVMMQQVETYRDRAQQLEERAAR